MVTPETSASPSPPPAKKSRRGWGCLIAVIIVLAMIGVVVWFVWQFIDNTRHRVEGFLDDTGVGEFFDTDTTGPCYDLTIDGDAVAAWTTVSCAGSRDAEVYHRWSFPNGSYPSDRVLSDAAWNTCYLEFEAYVGGPQPATPYGFNWLVPSERSWAGGDRVGLCLVVTGDGSRLTGQVKDSVPRG